MINKTRSFLLAEKKARFLPCFLQNSRIIHLIRLNPLRAGINKPITAQFT
jgi:hypothetical protein